MRIDHDLYQKWHFSYMWGAAVDICLYMLAKRDAYERSCPKMNNAMLWGPGKRIITFTDFFVCWINNFKKKKNSLFSC